MFHHPGLGIAWQGSAVDPHQQVSQRESAPYQETTEQEKIRAYEVVHCEWLHTSQWSLLDLLWNQLAKHAVPCRAKCGCTPRPCLAASALRLRYAAIAHHDEPNTAGSLWKLSYDLGPYILS